MARPPMLTIDAPNGVDANVKRAVDSEGVPLKSRPVKLCRWRK